MWLNELSLFAMDWQLQDKVHSIIAAVSQTIIPNYKKSFWYLKLAKRTCRISVPCHDETGLFNIKKETEGEQMCEGIGR